VPLAQRACRRTTQATIEIRDTVTRADHAEFLRAFLRSPGRVGAVAPSSPALASAMVHGLDLAAGDTVVEFGPGTGAFTAAIRGCLPSPVAYLGIEIEPAFVTLLRQRFADLEFVQGSAADAPAILAERGRDRVRAILCGLPFASLPDDVQQGIVAALDQLVRPGTLFRTFQYAHAYLLPKAIRFRRRMHGLFGAHARSPIVLWNVPPAVTLTWRR
jgi:phospholipid N-methyltransferase